MEATRYQRLFCLLVLGALFSADVKAQVTFTEVAADIGITQEIRSWSASWVDYDGDGDLDLFASRHDTSGGNLLLANDAGTFSPVDAGELTAATTTGSLGHTWADYDNDGDLDVYAVGGWLSGAGRLFQNDGGTFSVVSDGPIAPSANNQAWSAAWGDMDADGLVDLVLAHPVGFLDASQTNHLFRNEGNGAFERITSSPITTGQDTYTIATWSDHDLDGDLDLFIGSGPVSTTGTDHLYLNAGDGTFSRKTDTVIATDLRDGQVMNWQDIDNDGDLDLFVTNFRGAPPNVRSGMPDNLYINEGNGTYTKVTTGSLVTAVTGVSVANTWGDVDNDGDLDVFVSTGGAPGTDRLYLGDGQGGFTLEASFENGITSGATFGDYDNDGDLDLAVTGQVQGGSPLLVYRNDTSNGNAWLKMNLTGTASNRAGIGAKVYVRAMVGGSMVTMMREVSAQNTFGGQNALTVHFGLGDATSVEDVRIEWPGGITDTHTNVDINATHSFEEGTPTSRGELPSEVEGVKLGLAYPNPSENVSSIPFDLSTGGHVNVSVYDLLGRHIATLVDETRPMGTHVTHWNGQDDSGKSVVSGIYMYRMTFDAVVKSRMLAMMR